MIGIGVKVMIVQKSSSNVPCGHDHSLFILLRCESVHETNATRMNKMQFKSHFLKSIDIRLTIVRSLKHGVILAKLSRVYRLPDTLLP
jgi:hypothetical protein